MLGIWQLCDATQPVRQEGAAHLLATLAPDLPGCPGPVLSILLPLLLQLADVVEMACPPAHIRQQLPQPAVQPATLQVTEYALVALRLLDEAGPAGWLHKEWIQWHKARPELLERLTHTHVNLIICSHQQHFLPSTMIQIGTSNLPLARNGNNMRNAMHVIYTLNC